MQRIGHHPATAILRFVNDLTRIGGDDRKKPTVIVEDVRTTEWASITFVGLRHELDLRLEGERDVVSAALVRLADNLGDADLPIAGYFVAEIAVTAVGGADGAAAAIAGGCVQRVRIDALTVRD